MWYDSQCLAPSSCTVAARGLEKALRAPRESRVLRRARAIQLQQSCHSAAISPLEHVDAAPEQWRGAGGRAAEGQNGFARPAAVSAPRRLRRRWGPWRSSTTWTSRGRRRGRAASATRWATSRATARRRRRGGDGASATSAAGGPHRGYCPRTRATAAPAARRGSATCCGEVGHLARNCPNAEDGGDYDGGRGRRRTTRRAPAAGAASTAARSATSARTAICRRATRRAATSAASRATSGRVPELGHSWRPRELFSRRRLTRRDALVGVYARQWRLGDQPRPAGRRQPRQVRDRCPRGRRGRGLAHPDATPWHDGRAVPPCPRTRRRPSVTRDSASFMAFSSFSRRWSR